MNAKEATVYLHWGVDDVVAAITEGVALPNSGRNVRLPATSVAGDWQITEEDLDEFIAAFEEEEPGRHPPVAVCRELLWEAGYRCGLCGRDAPLAFHHILGFARLPHHDRKLMLAVCGICHDKIRVRQITTQDQRLAKNRLTRQPGAARYKTPSVLEPTRVFWDDLKVIVDALHEEVRASRLEGDSRYDLKHVDAATKNALNRMPEAYFAMMVQNHEPHFETIEAFLKSPANQDVADRYYELVDELRSHIAAEEGQYEDFSHVILDFVGRAVDAWPDELGRRRSTLNALTSFMYIACDIGRKS